MFVGVLKMICPSLDSILDPNNDRQQTTGLGGTKRWFMNACPRSVHFLNRLPNSIKDSPKPKALKTRLKRFLVSQAFYNAGELFAFDWETAQLEN
ncbi:hypothetical protein J6590_059991 [Homalodisca vitripennis]|nr:hypothetical protein J6590_059991 [Homalodisca vitripennis]